MKTELLSASFWVKNIEISPQKLFNQFTEFIEQRNVHPQNKSHLKNPQDFQSSVPFPPFPNLISHSQPQNFYYFKARVSCLGDSAGRSLLLGPLKKQEYYHEYDNHNADIKGGPQITQNITRRGRQVRFTAVGGQGVDCPGRYLLEIAHEAVELAADVLHGMILDIQILIIKFCRKALMARKVLKCLCPCFFTDEHDPLSIEMPLMRKVSKLEFPLRQHSPRPLQHKATEVLPHFCIQKEEQRRKSTSSFKGEQSSGRRKSKNDQKLAASAHYNPIISISKGGSCEEIKSFKSFKYDLKEDNSIHKSSSMKRSVKLLRFPNKKASSQQSEKFHSVTGGLMIAPCLDSNYQQIMDHMLDWVSGLDRSPAMIGETQKIDLERIKRIALLEVQTKVQQFQYFTQDHNTIYKNQPLQMQVDLKDFPKIFESNSIYATLCRFRLTCSPLQFFTLFNSPQCQSRLCNFSAYELVTLQPGLILSTQQMSNMLVNRRDLILLKFDELIAEEIGEMEKKVIVEIDRDLAGSGFKRITCVNREGGAGGLEVEIYTETMMNFRAGVDEKAYFEMCYRKFADYLLKAVKKLPNV